MPFNLTLKGLRIPFVAAWDLEGPNIREDSTIRADAVYTGVLDHRADAEAGRLGKVLLGQMAPQRQRYVMAHGLCQVCGQVMRHKIVLGHPEYHGPDRLLAFDEPPCCPACALVAMELCPYVRKGWADRGGLVVAKSDLFLQMVKMLPGDDPNKFCKSGPPLPRATFRRYLNKPLVYHLRMVPTTGMRIEGEDGLAIIQGLAADDKANGGPCGE